MRCFARGRIVRKYDKLSLETKTCVITTHCVSTNLGYFHSFRKAKEGVEEWRE